MTDKLNQETVEAFQRDFDGLRRQMARAIVGYEEVIDNLLVCFFAGGNLLIDSAPGLGKTLIAKTLSRVMDLHSARIQFTPDLMPADIIGTTIVQEGTDGRKHFIFQKGPVFTQLLLADEINRATPKTQSALLEAMQERRVTAAGKTWQLDQPYFVIATMNRRETGGTYSLPEAQVDRFFFRLALQKPDIDRLQQISRRSVSNVLEQLVCVIDGARAEEMKAQVLSVEAPEEVRRTAIDLVLRSHPHSAEGSAKAKKYLRYGSSPRGVQALILGGKVRALVAGRTAAERADVVAVAGPVLTHRLILNFEGEADGILTDDLIAEIVDELAASAKG